MFPRIAIRQVMRSSSHVPRTSKLQMATASSKYIPNALGRRLYSQQESPEPIIVDYDYVKKVITDNNVLIIDVREPDEIKELGKIPNSINIPLGNVTQVLSTTDKGQFEQTYKRPKPTEDTEIIFYCMIGGRSGKAQQNALQIGYKNAKNYLGSWTDWATKTQ